jgi:hypothetical protein
MYNVGGIIRFKGASTMKQLQREDRVKCGWAGYMEYLCGQTRKLTEDNVEKINNGSDVIWEECRFDNTPLYISVDMIELVN